MMRSKCTYLILTMLALSFAACSSIYAAQDHNLDIEGNATVIPDGDTTPAVADDTDHGSVNVGSSLPHIFTIRNTSLGNETITIGTVTVSGSTDFTITAQPATSIGKLGTTTFTVLFTPTGSGGKTATISVPNSANGAFASKNPYTFDVHGTAATVTVTPPTVATPSATAIEATTATLGGEVTATNNASITERGIYWSTTNGFTPPGQGTKVSSTGSWGTGTFTENVTGLPESTIVYFQAFAVNSAGTNYTSQLDFQTEPATQASGVTFSGISSNQMQVNWSGSGSGDGVLVVIRQGSAVNTDPTDGSEHAADPGYSLGAELGTGNYVVFRASGSSVVITNLASDTTYHVAVYAYAGTGAGLSGINYQQDSPAIGNQKTLVAAAPPAVANPSEASIEDTTATLGGEVTATNNASITERGVYWSTTNGFTPPGQGTKVSSSPGPWGTGTFTENVTGLNQASLIYYRAFAVNSEGTSYTAQASFRTEPTTQSSGVTFSGVAADQMQVNWSGSGSGDGVIVVIRQDSAVDTDPTDGTEHAVDTGYGLGAELGTGNYVVFRASGSSVVVTNLTTDTTYHVAVYAYAGSGTGVSGINYQQTAPATGSQKTLLVTAPPSVANPTQTAIEATTATLGGEVTATNNATITERGIYWSTSNGFTPPGQGTKVSSSGSWGTGTFTENVTGLNQASLIYYRAFAVNSEGTSYTAQASFRTEPTTQASGVTFSGVAGDQMQVNWSGSGSGDGVIVVIRQGSAVDTDPTDGTEHAADQGYSVGAELGTGNYVVFRASGSSVVVTNLASDTTYHVAVYAYAGSGTGVSGINYQQTSPATGSQKTLLITAPPAVANPTQTAIEDTTATLGGEVTATNNATITERGIYWSTSNGFTPPGQGTKVSSSGSWGTGTFTESVTSLNEASLIYYRAFAVNSAGTTYTAQASFRTEPTTQVSGLTISETNAYSMTVSWTGSGSGDGVIIVMKSGGAVSANPTDGTEHTANSQFGTGGTDLGAGNYVVFRAAGSSVVVTNLSPVTSYHVAAFAYAGSGTGVAGINYQQDSAPTANATTIGAPPTETPPTLINTTPTAIENTTATLGGEVTATNGATITERGIYWSTTDGFAPPGQGAKVSSSGSWGTGAFTENVTGLNQASLIYYKAFAVNSAGTNYTAQTAFRTEPTTQASNPNFTVTNDTSATLTWTGGSGDGTLVVVASGAVPTGIPSDGTEHTADPGRGIGEDIGGGSYVVYLAAGSTVTITNLWPNSLYYVSLYEYAGAGSSITGINYQQDSPPFTSVMTVTGLTWMGHNDKFGVSDCLTCHGAGHSGNFIPKDDEQASTTCGQCHNPTGVASNKCDVSLHLNSSSNILADCGTCHEVHGGSGLDEMITTRNSVTGTNLVYFRVDTNRLPQAIGVGVYHEATNFVYGSAPYEGPCQVCHTNTSRYYNTGGVDTNHAAVGSDCSSCHEHGNNFEGAGGTDCTACHNTTRGSYREIMSDFGLAATHIAGGSPTTNDCMVCHHEVYGNAYHGNNQIDLRNVDDDSVISITNFPFTRNTSSPNLEAQIVAVQDNFCFACHDSDGANGDTTPFSTAGTPANIFDAMAPSQNYYHPVRAVAANATCIGSGTMKVFNQSVHEKISCFDCHDVNGHGNANNDMLRTQITSPTDNAGTQAFCTRCHVLGSGFAKHSQGQHQTDSAGGVTSCRGCHSGPVNATGYTPAADVMSANPALDIHGGSFVWGNTGRAGANQATGRFISGGWISGWSPNVCSETSPCKNHGTNKTY